MKFFAIFLIAMFAAFSVAVATKSEVCSLKPFVIGHCRALVPSYSYNAETNECSYFGYGGCGGNDNRFDSQEACEAACKE